MSEDKNRHTVWLSEDAWDLVETQYRKDNCSTRNEYIEKAIRFYSGYRSAAQDQTYLPEVLGTLLEGKLNLLGDRLRKVLFKLAVNDAMLTTLMAWDFELDQSSLDRLRVQCVKDTKSIHGVIDLEDALKTQKEV